MSSGSRDAGVQYLGDGDTIINVNWDEEHPKKLYARWQAKTYKVRYYKGNAEQVLFVKGRRLAKQDGGDWSSSRELEVGSGYKIYHYLMDDST